MIGLEYVGKVFNMEQKDLAEMLNLSAPNISAWLKGTREIPTKYLHELSKIFNGLSPDYFQRELTYVDELRIQIYYIEKVLKYEERQEEEEFTVGALDDDDTLIIDAKINIYDERLEHLYKELNKTIKVNSYQDRLTSLMEQVWALDSQRRAELFRDKNAEDFIVGKLNNFMDFLSKFQVKDIAAVDLIINYLLNYDGIDQSRWGEQEVIPNEKLLAFYSDLKEVLNKHNVI
ncbi:helix-turn-helix domain-containing protein [Paenibacillus sp. LjRoot56]|uniref:helix-turn-helix domain-containing protein n=1 Tax=Paenibacillus sp. LjRoot56 TaxID=3342333 RepID=UPI003ED07444